MNKLIIGKIYSIILTVLFIGTEILLFLVRGATVDSGTAVTIGLFLALLLVTPVHELGHLVFAAMAKMKTVYMKFFCFSIQKQGGRYALKLVSPFSSDETQVLPTTGDNMKKRALCYAIGGLAFSFALIIIIVVTAVVLKSNVAWGTFPYAGYIFLLNALPFEYPSGKTDALVCLGIIRDEPSEKAMVLALDIQGRVYKEKRYAELSKELFDFPVLREDDPLFVVCWDLKYRFALDLDDVALAVDCIKRLSQAEEYMHESERERLACELTYLHALNGDLVKANECCKYCEDFLRSETPTAKRVLATVAMQSGEKVSAEILVESGLRLLEQVEIYGERKFEEELLRRIKFDD
jgi:hypothetical protein